jgi:hypothetical protein
MLRSRCRIGRRRGGSIPAGVDSRTLAARTSSSRRVDGEVLWEPGDSGATPKLLRATLLSLALDLGERSNGEEGEWTESGDMRGAYSLCTVRTRASSSPADRGHGLWIDVKVDTRDR